MKAQAISRMLKLSDGTYLIVPIRSYRVAFALSALSALNVRTALFAGILVVLAAYLAAVVPQMRSMKIWGK